MAMRFSRDLAGLLLAAGIFAGIPISGAGAQQVLERLSRDTFDVIAPSERVTGERGAMKVWQAACRVGPTQWSRRRMVDIAVQEWAYFGFQIVDTTFVEERLLPPGIIADTLNPRRAEPRIAHRYPRLGRFDDEPVTASTVGGYWSATPEGARVIAAQNRIWTGPGGRRASWGQPWSAAFVSWVACESGLGEMSQFARSVSHRVYIDQAIAARDGSVQGSAYVAYDIGEQRIEPGDILCNARGGTEYRSLADRRRDTGEFAPTHCDIVVKVDDAKLRIFVVGGNVLKAVSLTILPAVKEQGRQLRPLDNTIIAGARTIFAHMKLQADAIEMDALDHAPSISNLATLVRR